MRIAHLASILIGLTIFILAACGERQIKTPGNAVTEFDEFKGKEKFVRDDQLFYLGLSNPTLKPILTKKINSAADDFKKLAENGSATGEEYQEVIKTGLDRFSEIYLQLDTEDRERICSYFEELMDIVGLESSDGLLNDFMYGFEPQNK